MKKILYIILLLIICIPFGLYVEKINRRKEEHRQQTVEKNIIDPISLQENLHNVKFDGHLYVVYTKKNGGYGFGAAMVHSPNCECHKEKLNDEKKQRNLKNG